MQSTLYETLGWKKHKLESRLLGEISTTPDRQMIDTILMAESEEELKSLLMKVKKESEKAGLQLSIEKPKIMESSLITSWQIDGEKVETVSDFIFLGSKITVDSDCIWNWTCLLLGRKAMTNLDNILKSRNITLLTKSIQSKLWFLQKKP